MVDESSCVRIVAALLDAFDAQPVAARPFEHNLAVRFAPPAHDQLRRIPHRTQFGQRIDRLQPILVGIEAPHFDQRGFAA